MSCACVQVVNLRNLFAVDGVANRYMRFVLSPGERDGAARLNTQPPVLRQNVKP